MKCGYWITNSIFNERKYKKKGILFFFSWLPWQNSHFREKDGLERRAMTCLLHIGAYSKEAGPNTKGSSVTVVHSWIIWSSIWELNLKILKITLFFIKYLVPYFLVCDGESGNKCFKGIFASFWKGASHYCFFTI